MEDKKEEKKPRWVTQINKEVDETVLQLKRRELSGSGHVASRTAHLLRTVVVLGKFTSVQDLIARIKQIGKKLTLAQPLELAIGNTVRRVLFIIRQESASLARDERANRAGDQQAVGVDISLSLRGLIENQHQSWDKTAQKDFPLELKRPIAEEITNLMEEIKTVYINIQEQAVEHIYANEVILTFGISNTVLTFLQEAAKIRKFEVIVAESAPGFEGQKMAAQLSELVETTVITDSAVFAMMAHVNKVIIGTHGVVANGGLIAHTGAHNVAVAAKHHSVPFVVVTGLHKLCPLFAFDQDTFNEHNSPSQVLKFEEQHVQHVHVMNPAFDYIPPELVTLFVTNTRAEAPSYIYRLLAEYYDTKDYEL